MNSALRISSVFIFCAIFLSNTCAAQEHQHREPETFLDMDTTGSMDFVLEQKLAKSDAVESRGIDTRQAIEICVFDIESPDQTGSVDSTCLVLNEYRLSELLENIELLEEAFASERGRSEAPSPMAFLSFGGYASHYDRDPSRPGFSTARIVWDEPGHFLFFIVIIDR